MTDHKPHIKFSSDWDKLTQPRFTTIRTYRRDKEVFYERNVGKTFTLLRVPHEFSSPSKGRKIGDATLLKVEHIKPVRSLPVSLLMDDVRRNGQPDGVWMEKLVAMEEGLLLTFENHTGILRGWCDAD